MNLDLKPGWEKKAIIVVGIVILIIVIYAFNPFYNNPDVQAVQGQPTDTPVTTSAPPAVTSNNSTNNSTASNTTVDNGTFQISADVAKNIALGANPGYTAGQPTQGNVIINSTAVSVWIVPLTQGSQSKKVYVDSSTGVIVGSA
jgi:hypothetical protein